MNKQELVEVALGVLRGNTIRRVVDFRFSVSDRGSRIEVFFDNGEWFAGEDKNENFDSYLKFFFEEPLNSLLQPKLLEITKQLEAAKKAYRHLRVLPQIQKVIKK